MIISIMDTIEGIFNRISNILDKYSANPFFWVALLFALIGITFYAVNNLSGK